MRWKATLVTCIVVITAFMVIKHFSANQVTRTPPGVNGATTALKDLESVSGLSLSDDAVLIACDDGGGRDPASGFFSWVVFSHSQIIMPSKKVPGGTTCIPMPLNDSVKHIETSMQNREIVDPLVAFSSQWTSNGYEFRGDLVRSKDGDYLVVERFIQK